MQNIYIKLDGKEMEVAQGAKLCEIITQEDADYESNPIIGALVNGELRSLAYIIISKAEIETVRLFTPLGKRVYRHSICYLLCYAVDKVMKGRRLFIGHSLGDGYFFRFANGKGCTEAEKDALVDCMGATVQADLPITREKFPYKTMVTYFHDKGMKETESLLLTRNDPLITCYKLGSYLDLSYEPLTGSTGVLSLWELICYRDGLLLRYPQSRNFTSLMPFEDNPMLFQAFMNTHRDDQILSVECIGDLNKTQMDGNIGKLVVLAEALQNRNISIIASKIHDRKNVRIVPIAGPSSSGKTTFSMKLSVQLKILGYHIIRISLDDYYHTHDKTPRDAKGDFDFECLEALNLDLLRSQFSDLLNGKSVHLPSYDFKSDTRSFAPESISLRENSIIVMEGIHGLNPDLLPGFDQTKIFKIYISALTSINIDNHNRISTTDNRIIRRIVRDWRTRGKTAAKTLAMWENVEEGEKKYIFPYQNKADVMINSSLCYEFAALAPIAEPLLRSVKPDDKEVYATARRLLNFIELFSPISIDLVPPDSLAREFLGGSVYGAS